jgi:hypothetical protein
VPNPSLEPIIPAYCGIYTNSQFNPSFTFWTSPTSGTPDLYSTDIDSSCWNYQPNSQYPGPIGLPGSSMPKSGHHFVGFLAYSIAGLNQREYVQVNLGKTLIKDEYYCVEFWISLNDSREFAIDRIGAYLSVTPPGHGTDQPIPVIPQIETTTFQTDYTQWVKVSAQIQATDDWQYLTIGNFRDDNNTSTLPNPAATGAPGTYGSYYFLDDVSVTQCPFLGQENRANRGQLSVFPNPTTGRFQFRASASGTTQLQILDLSGKVLHQTHFQGNVELDISDWPKGLYLYECQTTQGDRFTGKLVLQ